MVKNLKGGSKAKGQARKYASGAPSDKSVRIAEEDAELYAQVTKLLGNGMCYVLCIDGVQRLCYIRGKFKGRGKRDNTLCVGSWVLVGVREFETVKENSGKAQNCDLMEVYSDLDKSKLKSTIHENWSLFAESKTDISLKESRKESGGGVGDGGDDGYGFDFVDEKADEYRKLMEEEMNGSSEMKNNIIRITSDNGAEEEEINIDDI
jgi:initiation factor 1A